VLWLKLVEPKAGDTCHQAMDLAAPSPPKPAALGCFLFSSEALCQGHPDKIADQVSDAVVDACLQQDPESKVSCETLTKTGMIMIMGEVSTKAKIDYDVLIRNTVKQIGYDNTEKGLDYKSMEIVNKIDVPHVVEEQHQSRNDRNMVASDQGAAFGYATNETPQLMPMTHVLATQLCVQLSKIPRSNSCIRPDGKAQVIMEYRKAEDGAMVPLRVHTVLFAVQHSTLAGPSFQNELVDRVVKPVIPAQFLDADTSILVNPLGRFVLGGPQADAGISGRQMAADTFGGWGSHGGMSPSGKDPSKVERAATYAARLTAKSLVNAGLAARCLVQVAYIHGRAEPVSLNVDSYGSARHGLSDADLCDIVKRNFDLRPGAIVEDLKLRSHSFHKFASFGFFGREDIIADWETCKDLSAEIEKLNNLVSTV